MHLSPLASLFSLLASLWLLVFCFIDPYLPCHLLCFLTLSNLLHHLSFLVAACCLMFHFRTHRHRHEHSQEHQRVPTQTPQEKQQDKVRKRSRKNDKKKNMISFRSPRDFANVTVILCSPFEKLEVRTCCLFCQTTETKSNFSCGVAQQTHPASTRKLQMFRPNSTHGTGS